MEQAVERAADATPQPGLGWLPRLLRFMLRWVLERLFTFEIEGLEHLPRGRYIAAANHPAWVETFALISYLPAERGMRMLASRAATTDIGWRRVVIDRADAILPIDNSGNGDNRTALRAAIDLLRRDTAIGIFPEDQAEPTPADGTVRPLQRGVAFLARAAEAPVVPIGICDTRVLWRGCRIRFRIGPPLPPPANRRADEAFVEQLRDAIEALRPRPEPLPARRPWPWLSKLF